MQIKIHLRPRKVGIILGTIALFLAIQSLFNEFLIETFIGNDSDSILVLVLDLFSVNLEESIPTWYSTINLLIASGLLALIAINSYKQREKFRYHWFGLALLFLYLSMDEGAVIHEILADPLQMHFNTSGFLSFGWQIVAFPLVVILGVVYLRFIYQLPSRIRNLIIISALLYVGGALIIEGISANQWYLDDGISLSYLAIATVEELFEMLGVVTFIYTLLSYIAEKDSIFILVTQPKTKSEENALESKSNVEGSTQSSTSVPKRLFALIVIMILGVNLMFLYFTAIQPQSPDYIEIDDTPFYQAIIEEYSDSKLVISYMNGIFGAESFTTKQIVETFANLYAEVMVVSLPPLDSSIVFVGDDLPFDRDEMSNILFEKGETQFIIFETDLVKTIIKQ